jgi:DNA repair protein RadC
METPNATDLLDLRIFNAKEYRVQCLRECPLPLPVAKAENPENAVYYWHTYITNSAAFKPEVENFFALLINTRRAIKAHVFIASGSIDTVHVHVAEVFRAAIICSTTAMVVMHNHPSGIPAPSESDIRVTRDLIRAGQLLKIELLDHVIIGNAAICDSMNGTTGSKGYSSLKELGYFYS